MKESQLEQLPVAKIKPATDNPRGSVGDVAELAASIETAGLLEPLLVTRRNGGYEVVAGHRRLAGAKKAGLKTVPAIVREFSEQERQEAMLIENLQREDLSPLEEAGAYARLVELGLSQRDLASRVGRTQPHISKRLLLLELPLKCQKAIDAGGITIEEALELAKLREHPEHLERAWKGPSYYPLRNRIDAQLREIERDERLVAETEAIKKEGIPLLQMARRQPHYWEPPKGTLKLGEWDGLDISVARHRKEPCHAAAVDSDGKRIYLCREPSRHAKTSATAKRKTDRDRQSAKRRAHEKELRTAAAARRAHVGSLLTSGLPKPEAISVMFEGFLRHCQQEPKKLACQLLGLEPRRTKRDPEYSYVSVDYDGALAELAAKSERDLLRVAAAIAFGGTEQYLSPGSYHGWRGDKPYFELLERHGYKTSAAEKVELAGKAPSR